jgi:hypothetical protein
MRVWDISPSRLCRQHLLGEHAEVHAIWSIINQKKKGFYHHPEVKRWRGKLKALYKRHERLVEELKKRGYDHQSPLETRLAKGKARQDKLLDSYEKQLKILKSRGCDCKI